MLFSSISLLTLRSFAELKPPGRPGRGSQAGKRKAPSEGPAETCAAAVAGATPPRKKLFLERAEPDGEPSRSSHDQVDNASAAGNGGRSTTSFVLRGRASESLASASSGQKLASSTDGTAAAVAVDASPSSATPALPYNAAKRSQVVVGVNAVTRLLEKNGLRFGLVCLSAKPPLLHRHLLQLAATRGVPFAALPALSETASPLLGVKSALAIGVKVGGWVTPPIVYVMYVYVDWIFLCAYPLHFVYSSICCVCYQWPIPWYVYIYNYI